MKTALIIKEDGLIYVGEVPEEPEYNGEIGHSINVQKLYYGQLEAAKESAILVSDQEKAHGVIWRNYTSQKDRQHGNELKPGIYPIPDLKWEVKQYFTREGDPDVELAILTLSEQPKPHGFCVTPNSNCTMNYCDENGCQERKRNLVEQSDKEWRESHDALLERRNELLDRVKSLEAENEELRKKGEWISVKERLPEVGQDVWINTEYYQSKGTYLGSDQYGDKFREGMQFPRYNFVTHWQPLPSPPKDEQPPQP